MESSKASGQIIRENSYEFTRSTVLPDPESSLPLQTPKSPNTIPLRRLAYCNKPEIPVLIGGTISAIVNGTIFPTFGILVASMIKTFYEPSHKLRKESKFWALMFFLLGVAALLVNSTQSYFFTVAGCKLIGRIRSLCFEKVVHMEVAWFDEKENSSGAVGARLSTDATTLRSLVGDALAQLVQDVTLTIAGLAIALVACWQLALIFLALIPLVVINGYVQMLFIKGFTADAKVHYLSHQMKNYTVAVILVELYSFVDQV